MRFTRRRAAYLCGMSKPDFLSVVAAPARRALEREGITTLKKLASKTQAEVMALHGMGPNAILKLQAALEEHGMSFKRK